MSSGVDAEKPRRRGELSMRAFITRLIWLCILPPLALAGWLAVDSVRTQQNELLENARHTARNFALALDHRLQARADALGMLALSTYANDPRRWHELYREAQQFQQSFESHVIFARASEPMQMLFNTRIPFGSALPVLPRPGGRAAAPTALATGKAAVGDSFTGPVIGSTLIAIAVPVQRRGTSDYLLLTTIEAAHFQARLDQLDIPAEWAITLIDGVGKPIARRLPARMQADQEFDSRHRIVAPLTQASWSVVLEIPRDAFQTPLTTAVARLVGGLLAVLLIGFIAGKVSARRLVRGVGALLETAQSTTPRAGIVEIAAVRDQLDAAAAQRVLDAQSLRASEERFTAMFEQAAVGIALVAPDGAWIRVNGALASLLGYTPDELLNCSFQDITHPDDLARDLDQVRRMLAREIDRYALEKRYIRKDGRQFWANLTVSLVWAAPDVPDYFVSVVEDIDARKKAQDDLLATKGKLEAALASMSDAVFIADTEGRFLEINEAFASFYRFANKDECARTLTERPELIEVYAPNGVLIPPERRAVRCALRGEAASSVELILRRSDTGESWVGSYSFAPIRNADGAIVGAVVSVRDVSERKAAEAELEQHRAHLEELVASRTAELAEANRTLSLRAEEIRELYDRAPCGYHSLSADGTILSVNETGLTLLGYARDEFVGHGLGEFMTPASVKRLHRSFSEFARSGRVRDVEFDFLRRDGTIVPCLVSSDLVRDAAGRFLHTHSTLVDNSERKAREHELALMQGELARRADEAETATRSKSAFLANMSHEIRTPMNAIIGLAHLVQRTGLPPEQAARMKKIESAGHHLLSIINDILDLSKIEAGRIELESMDFHLSAIFDNIQSLIGEQARSKGLAIAVDPDSVPVWLRGDPTRLRQALLNYASNAVKFTERGTITLRAILLEDRGDDLLVRFEVEDTGIGIAADTLPGLFQAFEQADASTTRKYGGTGLGLAITRRLAGLMDGEAGAVSTPGVGSTFWLTARLSRGHGIMPTVAFRDRTDAETRLRAQHGSARLLLAEDNEINREVALELLHSVGLSTASANSGSEALAMARATHYDLVLMDMQMPGMDGTEATRAIRALPGWSDTPILAMTANAFDDDRRLCEQAGMNDFITKPVDPETFFATLLKWLERAKPPTRTASEPSPALFAEAGGDPSAADELDRLPGIDSAVGLGYVRGKRDFYRQLLIRFRDDHGRNFVRKFRSARSAADWASAARMAHTLKGLSRSLGAGELAGISERLEHAARASDLERVLALESELEGEFTRVVSGLGALGTLVSAKPPLTTPAGPVGETERQAICERFAALLRARDTSAVAYFDVVEHALAGSAEGELAALKQAVVRYDYELALRLLAQGSAT